MNQTAEIAAASGLLGSRAARFTQDRLLSGADPSRFLAQANAAVASLILQGRPTDGLAIYSDPRVVSAARATGHLHDLHRAIGVLQGTVPVDLPRTPAGMGQDPYSAVIGAVATAVGQIAGAVPATMNAINQPKLQKNANQAAEIIAQANAQQATAQSQAWANSLAKSAPWIGAGALGLGLLGLAVL